MKWLIVKIQLGLLSINILQYFNLLFIWKYRQNKRTHKPPTRYNVGPTRVWNDKIAINSTSDQCPLCIGSTNRLLNALPISGVKPIICKPFWCNRFDRRQRRGRRRLVVVGKGFCGGLFFRATLGRCGLFAENSSSGMVERIRTVSF